MAQTQETLQGYVVDIACLRKYPRSELVQKAQAHSRNCGLMGHCAESGYGLVSQDGQLTLLDTHATPMVMAAVQESDLDQGIQLKVQRQMKDQEMTTQNVQEIA